MKYILHMDHWGKEGQDLILGSIVIVERGVGWVALRFTFGAGRVSINWWIMARRWLYVALKVTLILVKHHQPLIWWHHTCSSKLPPVTLVDPYAINIAEP